LKFFQIVLKNRNSNNSTIKFTYFCSYIFKGHAQVGNFGTNLLSFMEIVFILKDSEILKQVMALRLLPSAPTWDVPILKVLIFYKFYTYIFDDF